MRVFSETQRFNNQWWIKLLNLSMLGLLLFCFYKWFIQGTYLGNVPPDNYVGAILITSTTLLTVGFLYSIKLKTTIDEIGIHYQFIPFHLSQKTVRWNNIKKCYVRTYSPIKEYGGWGYRASLGKKGRAYNVKGNKGIQMILHNGQKILVGTQNETEAQQVIDRYYKIE